MGVHAWLLTLSTRYSKAHRGHWVRGPSRSSASSRRGLRGAGRTQAVAMSRCPIAGSLPQLEIPWNSNAVCLSVPRPKTPVSTVIHDFLSQFLCSQKALAAIERTLYVSNPLVRTDLHASCFLSDDKSRVLYT